MDYARIVYNTFRKRFGGSPILVRSPGRVNLLGEHTDYNQGFVLPAAIDKAIWFAVSGRTDCECRLYSVNMDQEVNFTLPHLFKSALHWPDYLLGVVDQLLKSGCRLSGFECVFGGDIPLGAGLSSSAAIEAGLAFALNQINRLGLDRRELAELAQRAENDYVGVRCGIMDQYVNLFGSAGHALRIDCRSLEHQLLPLSDPNCALLLFNSNVSHSLAESEYNLRRAECSRGVEQIRKLYPGVESLRDVSPGMLASCRGDMDGVAFRRCRYVIDENERMKSAPGMLERGDLRGFGQLMFQTHRGLRDDYQVSCPELDTLVELAAEDPEVYGARMMGGGFGGCTLNLVRIGAVARLCERVLKQYRVRSGIEAGCIVTAVSAGTELIEEAPWMN